MVIVVALALVFGEYGAHTIDMGFDRADASSRRKLLWCSQGIQLGNGGADHGLQMNLALIRIRTGFHRPAVSTAGEGTDGDDEAAMISTAASFLR